MNLYYHKVASQLAVGRLIVLLSQLTVSNYATGFFTAAVMSFRLVQQVGQHVVHTFGDFSNKLRL